MLLLLLVESRMLIWFHPIIMLEDKIAEYTVHFVNDSLSQKATLNKSRIFVVGINLGHWHSFLMLSLQNEWKVAISFFHWYAFPSPPSGLWIPECWLDRMCHSVRHIQSSCLLCSWNYGLSRACSCAKLEASDERGKKINQWFRS